MEEIPPLLLFIDINLHINSNNFTLHMLTEERPSKFKIGTEIHLQEP